MVIRIFRNIVTKVATSFFPADLEGFMIEALRDNVRETDMENDWNVLYEYVCNVVGIIGY